MNLGYRQFGYPLAISVSRALADAATVEPLLFTAALQRFLLVLSSALAVVLWRWWAIPLLVFVLAAETLAYPKSHSHRRTQHARGTPLGCFPDPASTFAERAK